MTNVNTIIISGASRGIGYAIAQLFASHGWNIITVARKKEDLEAMEKVWKKEYPESRFKYLLADLSTQKGCDHFTSNIRIDLHRIQVLVNNVGQFAPGTLLEGEADQLAHFLQTNVLSAHYLTRGLYRILSQTKQSHVFTIGSIAADNWPPQMAAYALSKETLHAWHRGMKKELLEHGIHSTLIIPGATYTSSWAGIDVDPKELLTPEEVAQLVWDNWAKQDGEEEIVIIK